MADDGDQREGAEDPRSTEGERRRVVAAFGRAAAEQGYQRLTFERVAHYAGLSTDLVEAQFSSLEAGLLATQEAFLERLRLDAIEACAGSSSWAERMQAALASILASLAEASALARVLSVEVAGASLGAAEQRFAVLDGFAQILAEGRVERSVAVEPPRLMEQVIVGGLASIIVRHLLTEEPEALLTLQPEMVELALLPYVGPAEARRVARDVN